MIHEFKDYPANGMTYKQFMTTEQGIKFHNYLLQFHALQFDLRRSNAIRNPIDSRPKLIKLLDLFNNFWFGLVFASFLWVWPFTELAKMIGDSIALHCGAK